jgi:hypothetical protein
MRFTYQPLPPTGLPDGPGFESQKIFSQTHPTLFVTSSTTAYDRNLGLFTKQMNARYLPLKLSVFLDPVQENQFFWLSMTGYWMIRKKLS